MLQRILGSVKILGLCATFGVAGVAGAAQAAVLEHTQDAPYRTAANVAVEKVNADSGVIVSTPPATEHGGFDLKPQAEVAPAPVATPVVPMAPVAPVTVMTQPAVASVGQDDLLKELQTLDINQMNAIQLDANLLDANQAATQPVDSVVQKTVPVAQTVAEIPAPAGTTEYTEEGDITSTASYYQGTFVEPVGAISPIMFTQQGGVVLPFDR